ncbi:MAG TPA: YraN family protein [Anaerolineae bacterium]|nr:YraN family protein [Anaerolineae bacterium]HID84304.1 YraN family protein [Anaerolineales bacterium]HIQ09157.1 YraN family protein [Anaerolineaceae bacterium]
MNRLQRRGRWGEKVAARYLAARGYRILARNVRTPYGELDLIAQQGDEVVFVEVKTRTSLAFGWPEEGVTGRKLRHLAAAAQAWLGDHPNVGAVWRVDVIAVLVQPGRETVQIRHYEDVLGL